MKTILSLLALVTLCGCSNKPAAPAEVRVQYRYVEVHSTLDRIYNETIKTNALAASQYDAKCASLAASIDAGELSAALDKQGYEGFNLVGTIPIYETIHIESDIIGNHLSHPYPNTRIKSALLIFSRQVPK